MANRFKPTYDPGIDSGTSGAEASDLNPGSDYNTDLRYGSEKDRIYESRADLPTVTAGSWPERASYTREGDIINEERAEKFIKSAKAAGKFKIASDLKEYTNNGETPRNSYLVNARSFGPPFGGVQTPSMGESGGRSGAVAYADKPGSNSGKAYNWLDAFG
jgi:hypothetical protein